MAKVEITMTADYIESWGLWEGIRELMQNARDGEIEENAPMSAGVTPSGDKLQIENKGVTLSRDALLIGHTTKRSSTSALGQFGEGLKLGTLALCRLGYSVTIYNGGEIWTAGIEQSEKFGREVLVFHIKKSRSANPKQALTVSVAGVTQELWDSLRDRFLFLQEPNDMITVPSGKLILDPQYRGRIYVKGIYVADERVNYGYDLPSAAIDRDRQMVKSFDLQWEAARIWEQAMTHEKGRQQELSEKAFEMLEQSAYDMGLFANRAMSANDEVLENLHQVWKEKYGKKSYPVSSMSESRELSYLNAEGVVCSNALRETIQKRTGRVDEIKKELNHVNKRFISWQDLHDDEKLNLGEIVHMVGEVIPEVTLDAINVVEFPDNPDTMGYFDQEAMQVVMARPVLADLANALHTLAHEVPHIAGKDGEAQHTAMVGDLLAKIAINNKHN